MRYPTTLAARLLLAALLLTAGLIKAGASEGFAVTIAQFTILPPTAVSGLAIALPWAEIVTAILLLIPRTARLGAALAALLFATFIAAIAWALSQGLIVDCGCFGESEPSLEKMITTLLRDVVLLLIALALVLPRPAPPTRPAAP
jgi:uncharacterized membrane protein YphA (DoxX/SURF4 family)